MATEIAARDPGRLRQILRRSELLRFCKNMLSGSQMRAVAWLQLRKPRGLFQPYPETRMMRRPRFFAQARALTGDTAETHILSFGCSTGDEVVSLRRYFPHSRITGIDINPRNIAHCRTRSDIDSRMAFLQGSTVTPEMGPFDAIFALSVFRHGDLKPRPPRCDHLIRFEEFDRITSDLIARLRPGGLYLTCMSNFRIRDTQAGSLLELVENLSVPPNIVRPPIYGRDNRLIAQEVDERAIYRKKLVPR